MKKFSNSNSNSNNFNIKRIAERLFPLLSGFAIAACLLALNSAAALRQAHAVETSLQDFSTETISAITVESWDRDYSNGGWGWEVYTNKDPEGKGAYQNLSSGLLAEREVKLLRGRPAALRGGFAPADARILGVKFAFSFPGYNTVTIQPPAVDHFTVEKTRPYLNEAAITEEIRRPSCYQDPTLSTRTTASLPVSIECVTAVQLPGEVKKLSVWVLGRGNQYDLEAWLEDWRGDTHILKFGSVDFIGWRQMSVAVPATIPQDPYSFPQTKALLLKKLKLRSHPHTSLDTVHIFFDELRILTKTSVITFDGADIDFDKVDCDRKNSLIKTIKNASRFPQLWQDLSDCTRAPGPAAPFHQEGPSQGPSQAEDQSPPASQ